VPLPSLLPGKNKQLHKNNIIHIDELKFENVDKVTFKWVMKSKPKSASSNC